MIYERQLYEIGKEFYQALTKNSKVVGYRIENRTMTVLSGIINCNVERSGGHGGKLKSKPL